MIHTGDWSILGNDCIRRWPSKIEEPRPVEVTIRSWVGVSLGARHVMLSVQEEDNAWWCEAENTWVKIYSDSTAKGFSLNANVYTEEEAKQLAIYFLRDVIKVTEKTHTLDAFYRDAIFGKKT